MQTFLPSPDIYKSAEMLDRQRLGKQRVEAMQILTILAGTSKGDGFRNHPATLMWKGHELGLTIYLVAMIEEWKRRRYLDSVESFLSGNFSGNYGHARGIVKRRESWGVLQAQNILPIWFGGLIHSSHRAALLAKDANYYSKFGWSEQPKIDYYWPTKQPILFEEEPA